MAVDRRAGLRIYNTCNYRIDNTCFCIVIFNLYEFSDTCLFFLKMRDTKDNFSRRP